jgi:hypothetical protein
MLKLIIFTLLMLQNQSDNKRVLTLFAMDADHPVFKEQLSLLEKDKERLQEHDIIIKTIIHNSQTADIFKKKNIRSKFTITLTGKDGGEKYRSFKLTTTQELYNIIDVMPMRKAEMKKRI